MQESSDVQSEPQPSNAQANSVDPASIRTIRIRGDEAWIGWNNSVAVRIDLTKWEETQRYKGHVHAVNCVKVYAATQPGSGKPDYVLTGSVDKSIRIWKEAVPGGASSVTDNAHNDSSGVRSLLVIPSNSEALKGFSEPKTLLLSSGLRPMVGLWDLSNPAELKRLASDGASGDITRSGRADCLAGPKIDTGGAFIFFTGHCGPEVTEPLASIGNGFWWRASQKKDSVGWDLIHQRIETGHTQGINDMIYVAKPQDDQLWTASADKTVKVHVDPCSKLPTTYTLGHNASVRAILHVINDEKPYVISGAGETLRVWAVDDIKNINESTEPVYKSEDLGSEIVAIRLWKPSQSQDSLQVVVARVDGWILTYKLLELLEGPIPKPGLVQTQPESSISPLRPATDTVKGLS